MCVHMKICTHTHTHIHTHTHTHTHTHACTHMHTGTRTHTNTQRVTYVLVYNYITLPYKAIIKLCGMMQLLVIWKPYTIATIYCITLNSVCMTVKACLLPWTAAYPGQSPLLNLDVLIFSGSFHCKFYRVARGVF